MSDRRWTFVVAVALATVLTIGFAQGADDKKYPDWRGQWARFVVPGLPGQPSHDQTKAWGKAQEAPLTPEYQAILDASIADQAQGGLGNFPTTTGRAAGMPHMMMAFYPLEFVVTPDCTYILVGMYDHYRRIFTDGRDWPADIIPSYQGYSIGKWIDEDGDGKYDVLEIETRDLKLPRGYDISGLPFHSDSQAIIKERIYLDKNDRNVLYDQITVIDHALTRPYTKLQKATRNPNPRPVWLSEVCSESNTHIRIGNDEYYVSADGKLMPSRKNQAPPDLSYFKQTKK